MRALILQFEESDPPSHLGHHLTNHDVGWDTLRMDLPHAAPSLDGYDMLVALGGAMSANDTAEYPFLEEARDLIRHAVSQDLPYLGICLGGQLLAHALGAPVSRNPAKEVGLIDVTLSPAAADDPLLAGLGPVIPTAQFHEDTFALPAGGVLLASSALCRHQIARCASRAYALQFHPETSWQEFASWIEHGYLGFVGPDQAVHGCDLVAQVREHDAAIRAAATALFDNFLRLATRVPEFLR